MKNNNCYKQISIGKKQYGYFDLQEFDRQHGGKVAALPYSLKILLENLLRRDDGSTESQAGIAALVNWQPQQTPHQEIAFMPARVVMQDFTGVPAIVDLAVMRDAMSALGGDPKKINPQLPVDLVIDHSVQVDAFGTAQAFGQNVEKEYERNIERYTFLRWGQVAFSNLRVVPPGTGIVHQVNLEYLAPTVFLGQHQGKPCLYPDTVVGTDSHTTMINGLGVLGWGVGGIEAEAAMLGQPISLLIPKVVGFELTGQLPEGATATDLVLRVTQMLRSHGVVDKFVEFYGPGVQALSLADRATISNMAPEYGATCGLFPIDDETLNYLRLTGRDEEQIALVEAYAKAQGFFGAAASANYSEKLKLDLQQVEPAMAGPKRPQDRFALSQAKAQFTQALSTMQTGRPAAKVTPPVPVQVGKTNETSATPTAGTQLYYKLNHGAVVIAAITSCTNTSNPMVMLAAGLVAKKAVQRGLKRAPWVKTSLAPGSKVVSDYLVKAGLQTYLDQLGFNLVGYGCTTCIGNSGPLPPAIGKAVEEGDLLVAAVLSGNRNFEGRINPLVRAAYLASPPLVVAYALAGKMDIDLYHEPLGLDMHGKAVMLKDIWPSQAEIRACLKQSLDASMFEKQYATVFSGDSTWQKLPIPKGDRYRWQEASTYIKAPPFFDGITAQPPGLKPLKGLRVLAMLGDSVTTDHISPAGNIAKQSPAADYLRSHKIEAADFNSYGARRGNFEVMRRGTFANIRLHNLLVPNSEGGVTLDPQSGQVVSIADAATTYAQQKTPLMIIAGKEYGSGSSRDWAAKGPALLGVRVVLAQSFERIHRSNLIGMGILPLQFVDGQTPRELGISGFETFELPDLNDNLQPGAMLKLLQHTETGKTVTHQVRCRLQTMTELNYLKHGGILQFVLRELAK